MQYIYMQYIYMQYIYMQYIYICNIYICNIYICNIYICNIYSILSQDIPCMIRQIKIFILLITFLVKINLTQK